MLARRPLPYFSRGTRKASAHATAHLIDALREGQSRGHPICFPLVPWFHRSLTSGSSCQLCAYTLSPYKTATPSDSSCARWSFRFGGNGAQQGLRRPSVKGGAIKRLIFLTPPVGSNLSSLDLFPSKFSSEVYERSRDQYTDSSPGRQYGIYRYREQRAVLPSLGEATSFGD